jgi:hypothetical protein
VPSEACSDDASDIAGVGLAVAIDRRPKNDQRPMAEGLSGSLSGGPSAAKQEPLWFPENTIRLDLRGGADQRIIAFDAGALPLTSSIYRQSVQVAMAP